MQCDGGSFIFIKTNDDLYHATSLLTKDEQLIPVIENDNMRTNLLINNMAPISLTTLKQLLINNILENKKFIIYVKGDKTTIQNKLKGISKDRYDFEDYPLAQPEAGAEPAAELAAATRTAVRANIAARVAKNRSAEEQTAVAARVAENRSAEEQTAVEKRSAEAARDTVSASGPGLFSPTPDGPAAEPAAEPARGTVSA